MPKQKKKFKPGTEDAGMKSAYSKIRRIRVVLDRWDKPRPFDDQPQGAPEYLKRIRNIVGD